MRDKKGLAPVLAIAAVMLVIAGNPFYILTEAKQAVITRFGEPIGAPKVQAGLRFKLPFIDKVSYFEKRILEWYGYSAEEIPTRDKKFVWIDYAARWRIKDALKFFQSVHDEAGGHQRLDNIIDSVVRDVVSYNNLIEIVRSSNRVVEESAVQNDREFIEDGALEEIRVGRDGMRRDIIAGSKEELLKYGIELIDVRIRRVNYGEKVKAKVYDRMIAERKRAAEQYRSEGRGVRAEVEGRTAKELKKILSQAYKESQEIKGQADAASTKIYADAYNKDQEFFTFLKTLDTYKDTIDDSTTLILTTEGDYFKYLKEIYPSQSLR